MKLHTEKEFFSTTNYFAFKLRNLHLNDKNLFYQVAEYIPNLIYTHSGIADEISYKYHNNSELIKSPETDMLFEKGGIYLHEISCPTLLKRGSLKTKILQAENNIDSVCSYLQKLRANGKMIYTYTNKLILKDNIFFNISNRVSEMHGIGEIFASVFDPQRKDVISWQDFFALTKQEKMIIKLLAKGHSNKMVGEILFISPTTVKTHRRNIYRKLNIHNTSDLVRIAITLDLSL